MTIFVPDDKPHLKEAAETALKFMEEEPEATKILASGDVEAITKWIHEAETPEKRNRRKVMSFGARWGTTREALGDYKEPTVEEVLAILDRWRHVR